MAGWLNNDELYIKFGTEEGVSAHPGGNYGGFVEGENVCEVVIDLTKLTETETVLNDVVIFPNNAHITKVEVFTVIAAATGVAIDVGFQNLDRSTEIDYNGLLAAFVTADMNAVGESVQLWETHTLPAGIATVGALVGQELTTGPGYITASRTTATAFTAGKVRLRVHYIAKGIDNPT